MTCTWGKKLIVHVYIHVQLYLLVRVSKVPLKRRRAELHIDTKNKAKHAEMTDVEMIKILAAYC